MSNTSLVFLSEDQTTPVTSSEVIATALDKDHKDVLALAKKYEPDLEEFGPSSFKTKMVKIGSGAQRVKEIAILNESQATLLITYMRNSEKVRKFKIALVKAFFEMREKIYNSSCALIKKQAFHEGYHAAQEKNISINTDDLKSAIKTLHWLNSNRSNFKSHYDKLRQLHDGISKVKLIMELLWSNLEISSRYGEEELVKILKQVEAGR